MPKKPQRKSGRKSPALSLLSHAHAHTLPSFKEGERVNMTPVKYHGGRNYKIATYRNPRPQLETVCQDQTASSCFLPRFLSTPCSSAAKPNLAAFGLALLLMSIPTSLSFQRPGHKQKSQTSLRSVWLFCLWPFLPRY